jgi:hypothetical protein
MEPTYVFVQELRGRCPQHMLVKVEDCCRDAFVMRVYHD